MIYEESNKDDFVFYIKISTSGLFKGEARYQFLRNLKKMAKDGWHVHTVTDESGTFAKAIGEGFYFTMFSCVHNM